MPLCLGAHRARQAGSRTPPPTSLLLLCILSVLPGLAGACASAQAHKLAVAQAREKLRAALNRPVHTRQERDDQSRLLVDAVDNAELERLSLAEVQAVLGRGHACQASQLCSAQGFTGDDVYYVIGSAQDKALKQLPTLILGFDPHGRVQRVFALRTH